MPGLPKKYAAMGFAKGWRAYRASKSRRKTPKASTSRPAPKRGTTMPKRKGAVKRFFARRSKAVPLADGLTAFYALDGMTDKRVSAAAVNVVGAVAGTPGMSFQNAQDHAVKGVQYALNNPKDAITNGVKNFATVYLVRKVMGFIGIPRTVNLFGKRIQVR